MIVTDFLRALVNIETETDSVTCSVAEIALKLPERASCGIINLTAGSAGRENCHRQAYMASQDKGVIFHLQLRARAERYSSGNVGSPVVILAAGIAEIQAVRLQYS